MWSLRRCLAPLDLHQASFRTTCFGPDDHEHRVQCWDVSMELHSDVVYTLYLPSDALLGGKAFGIK